MCIIPFPVFAVLTLFMNRSLLYSLPGYVNKSQLVNYLNTAHKCPPENTSSVLKKTIDYDGKSH